MPISISTWSSLRNIVLIMLIHGNISLWQELCHIVPITSGFGWKRYSVKDSVLNAGAKVQRFTILIPSLVRSCVVVFLFPFHFSKFLWTNTFETVIFLTFSPAPFFAWALSKRLLYIRSRRAQHWGRVTQRRDMRVGSDAGCRPS